MNERNDGLHPQHPGRGKCSVIEVEDPDRPEIGGFLIFLPSGETKSGHWQTAKAITPTLEAAKKYATAVVESLIEKGGIDHPDIQGTNWTSVTAAIQRVILDFNDRVVGAVNAKMMRDFMTPEQKRWVQ